MKHILITAYDVNPYQGSESATGWNYPYQLSKTNKITLVTRENNVPEIERYLFENNLNSEFFNVEGFDLPIWARFWKRGARGSFLYFYLWQLFVSLNFLGRKDEFDICHSLNFHCDWAPSFLWILGKPFVWGPINHNEKLPDYLFDNVPFSAKLKDNINNFFKFLFWNFDPFLYLCKVKADKILVGHPGVIISLHLNEKKCVLFNQIATDERKGIIKDTTKFNVLFVGRGLLIKNYFAVLEAFENCVASVVNNSELSVTFVGVGDTAREEILKKSTILGIEKYLDVHSWVSFERVSEFYESASVLCFPSFEGAGMVIAESLSYCTPVITIDRNGASHELDSSCSYIIKSKTKEIVVDGITSALIELLNDESKLLEMSSAAITHANQKLSWSAKSKFISTIYSAL